MEIKFYTEKGILDLSNQKISFQESNSKMNDNQLTKFTFPFELLIDEDFINTFGDYMSHENWNLQKIISGKLLSEGKVHDAKLEIVSIEGNLLTGQIDFGFESVPNGEKKLADLPLEKIKVDDIHTYAAKVCEMKYPETNFNFPKIHTKKYNPSEVMWDAFEGYYNHTIMKDEGLEMARNVFPTEQNNWTIDNVNIIHPCPHILYLLKMGFADVGYTLAGEILTDENLQQRWVFSGGQYFRNKWILNKDVLKVYRGQYSVKRQEDRYNVRYEYDKSFTIEKPDSYRLDLHFDLPSEWTLKLLSYKIGNGNIISLSTNDEKGKFSRSIFLNIQDANTEIEISADFNWLTKSGADGSYSGTGDGSRTGGTRDGSNEVITDRLIFTAQLRSRTAYDDGGNTAETKVVENENEIDLSRAVPDMTFGELVTIIQNWFNYDLAVTDKTITMNKIGDEAPPVPKDFRNYEVKAPKRTLLSDKSFLLKFIDLDDGFKLDSMYYDRKGEILNGKGNDETSTIEINGYPMPIARAKEHHLPTAQVKKDSDAVLALVYYDGLIDGYNNATNPPGCSFPELFKSNWEKWLKQRVASEEYQWRFLAKISDMSNISISDYLFCYQKKHIIKTITKDKIADNIYEVEMVTETVI